MRNLLRELSFQDLVLKHYKVSPDYNPNKSGRPYQYFHYTAFGEVLVQRDANYGSFQTSYTFNAKEFDAETGYGYYGARYYNPTFSVWLGVDPKAHWYPGHSPFNFSLNNPVMLVDPNGMWVKGGDNWFGRFFQKVGNVFTGNGWNTNKELEEAEWVRKYEAEGNTILDEIVINIAKKENKQSYGKEGYGDSNEQHIKWPDAENKGDPIEDFPMGGSGKAVGSWGEKLYQGLDILRKWISWGTKDEKPAQDETKSQHNEPPLLSKPAPTTESDTTINFTSKFGRAVFTKTLEVPNNQKSIDSLISVEKSKGFNLKN